MHRVAVALGSRAQVSFEEGDLGKGFVHVLDESGLDRVLDELDTVTDFVNYLVAKENLVTSRSVIVSAEEDLLAVYLHRGRQFPAGPRILRVQAGAWNDLVAKSEWGRRKEADRTSTAWDGLVETFHKLVDPSGKSPTEALDHLDGALRTMAREDRLSRRILGSAFLSFMREAATGRVNSRMLTSPSGVVYVFLASDRAADGETNRLDREARRRELALRCFVARGQTPTSQTVVGIATERYVPGGGFSLDGHLMHKPSWTEADQRASEGIQRDLGYFRTPRTTPVSVDEYPDATPTLPRASARSNASPEDA